MRDRFGIFETVIRIRKLSLLLVVMLRIPNTYHLEFYHIFAKKNLAYPSPSCSTLRSLIEVVFVELTKTCMYALYVSYSIEAYMELKVIQGNNILTLYMSLNQNSNLWRGISYS